MCDDHNWHENNFKRFAEKLNTHNVLYYPDRSDYRGSPPVDFSLMGSPNIQVECKFIGPGKLYAINRISKNQYYKLNMQDRYPNIQSFVCIAYGEPKKHIVYMIPWGAYKLWFAKYIKRKELFTNEEIYEDFFNFTYNFKKTQKSKITSFFDYYELYNPFLMIE